LLTAVYVGAYIVVIKQGAEAQRGTMMIKTAHKQDCKRVFKNYDLSCKRCVELSTGSKPRTGWGDHKREMEAQEIRAIRAHDCKASNCGPVCTFGDW
jgi:hypothetical protein